MSTFLPLAGPGSRPHFHRCAAACGDDCFKPVPNPTDNETFAQVVERGLSRRAFLRAGTVSALVLTTGAVLAGTATAAPGRPAQAARAASRRRGGTLGFTPLEPNIEDAVVVPEGYASDVLLRWGDPILPGAPEFDFDNQTLQSQLGQFGYNCDYVAFFPLPFGSNRSQSGLLSVNHEYTNEDIMFPGYIPGSPTPEQIDVAIAAHGLSIVEIARDRGRTGRFAYQRRSRYNRRLTGFTPLRLSGPAAGSELLRTSDDPTGTVVLGTLNNCAGGVTPWGTVLTCEENFNQYFANAATLADDDPRKAIHARYGLPSGPSRRLWETRYRRFDLAQEPNEPFRFGWVVEVDPYDPDFVPRKRTAMGRMKHEGAETTLARDRRVVSYLGDDERFDYVYKFVSDEAYRPRDRAHNLTLLDSGTIYVARFDADEAGNFTGRWIPLTPETPELASWTLADILINTRGAADAVGATKMDRPEDIERNPVTGAVYIMLTNNTRRTEEQEDAANPRGPNRWGHVIELRERGNDAAATEFDWEIFILCGDPDDPETYWQGYPREEVSPIGSPDNCAFDNDGNLWIATDGTQPLGTNDGFFACPVEGRERGHVQLFLTVPPGAEACGPYFTPDNHTIFCAVQHPGQGSTLAAPISTFPDGPGNPPRPTVVSVWRAAPGDPRIGK